MALRKTQQQVLNHESIVGRYCIRLACCSMHGHLIAAISDYIMESAVCHDQHVELGIRSGWCLACSTSTGYHSIFQRPSPVSARSMLPYAHSGHSLSTIAIVQLPEMGVSPRPSPGGDPLRWRLKLILICLGGCRA